jgi:hypothetical protein
VNNVQFVADGVEPRGVAVDFEPILTRLLGEYKTLSVTAAAA